MHAIIVLLDDQGAWDHVIILLSAVHWEQSPKLGCDIQNVCKCQNGGAKIAVETCQEAKALLVFQYNTLYYIHVP